MTGSEKEHIHKGTESYHNNNGNGPDLKKIGNLENAVGSN